MADNFVQIRIKASDTAKPELDSLRADLDELGSKVDTAKVKVDDDEAKAKLLAINAELAALNKRVANPKIDSASAARAEARIEKLKGDMDDLIKKSNSAPRGGVLGKLLFGALGHLPGGGAGEGGAEGEGGSALGILGNLGGLAAGGGAIAFGLGAILVEVDGLVSGLAAAGAGAGAFALLAIPAFDKVKTAFTNVTAAQQAYHKAQLTESMDPTKANATAVAKSLLNLKEAWKGLDPAERGAVHGIQDLERSWQRMSKAFEPDAFKVFNDGLKIANKLLPDVKPFADTFANSLDGLLRQVSKFAGSTGFKDWLAQFQKLEGPSVKAIGEGIGHVAVAFGKLLTVMSAKDVVNAINIAFSILSGTLSALTFIIRRIMERWDQWQQLFRQSRHAVAEVAHDYAQNFDSMRHTIADFAHNAAAQFDHVRANIHRWADDVGHDTMIVVHWFEQLPGRILSALASLPGRLFSLGAHIISMLAAGIRSAIGDVTGAIGSVAGEILSHIPMSPAKKGPLSGRGDPRLGGMRIAEMLAQGLTEGSGAVDAAANRLTGGARFGGGRGGVGGGGELTLRLELVGSDSKFMTALMNQVRVQGGDPRMFQRKVAFR